MKPLNLLVALALLFATIASAQPFTFGETFPLTNTRYDIAGGGVPRLYSNGQEVIAFWKTTTNLRATKVAEGERRGGRHIMDGVVYGFDVAFNGTRFLVVATTLGGTRGRFVDRNGLPEGEVFTIPRGHASPKLASSRGAFVMLYLDEDGRGYVREVTASGDLGTPVAVLPPGEHFVESYDIFGHANGYTLSAALDDDIHLFTLDSALRVRSESILYHAPTRETRATSATLATNGRSALAAWATDDGRAYATAIASDGTHGPLLMFDDEVRPVIDFSIVWTGSDWAAAYWPRIGGTITLTHFDEPVRRSLGKQQVPGVYASLAPANGGVVAAWIPSSSGTTVIGELPFGAREPQPLMFAALQQALPLSATANGSTLVVWTEAGRETVTASVHAGVRERDGRWTERKIADNARVIRAASNGQEFLVLLRSGGSNSLSAAFLDGNGRVRGERVPVPLRLPHVAWDGSNYLLFEGNSVAKLSPSGTFSSPVVVASPDAIALGIASNGATTVAAWLEPEPCNILCIGPYGELKVSRLSSSLQPLDASPLVLAERIGDAAIAWDGTRFVVVDNHGYLTGVPSAGATQPLGQITGFRDIAMEPVPGGVALLWSTSLNERFVAQTAVLKHNNGLTAVTTLDALFTDLELLPDGGLLYLAAVPRFDAPHHGSRRVVARIASPVPAEAPDSPALAARQEDGQIHLRWTAPREFVSGYRIEYRIGTDGLWHELEDWFDAGELSHIVPWSVTPGTRVMFRMRAFNEAGGSEYSQESGVNLPRRRAVR